MRTLEGIYSEESALNEKQGQAGDVSLEALISSSHSEAADFEVVSPFRVPLMGYFPQMTTLGAGPVVSPGPDVFPL